MPGDVDRVNAVISKTETIQARYHKGNAAALHQVFATSGAVSELFKSAAPMGTKPDPIDMRIALAEKNIFLNDAQIQKLCAAGKDNFFATLLEIQKAEIKTYVDAQPKNPTGGLRGTTPGYYNDVLNLINSESIANAQDYVNALKNHSTATAKPGQKKEDVPKGQLMLVMNREYLLYAEVPNKKVDYGSKADNVRYHYYQDVINDENSAHGEVDAKYNSWKDFVADNHKNFPGGFHIKVDTVYEKKGHIGHVKDPRPEGKGHHISLVNLGMSNEQLVDTINDRTNHCPMHDVQFTIGGKKYGIYLVDEKPLTFYKAELNTDGSFKKANGNVLKSLLKASESSNLKETQLTSPKGAFDSVTHAMAHSLKQMKQINMGLTPDGPPTPYLTSDADGKHDFGVGSGSRSGTAATPSTAALDISKGGASPAPAAAPLAIRKGAGPGVDQNAEPSLNIGDPKPQNPNPRVEQASITSLSEKKEDAGIAPNTLKIKN